MAKGLERGPDDRPRCWWPGSDADYLAYHDQEWGRPVVDDDRLFEKLCLEGFQAGLSWLTILRKRESFRRAFRGFDYRKVARFGPSQVEKMLTDASIVRHRGKIESAINNARRAREVVAEHGSLAAYFWSWEPEPEERPRRVNHAALQEMASTEKSKALSKDLKRRGFSFVGPTTAYAFMQAMGLVNDHLEGCCMRPEVEQLRAALDRGELSSGGREQKGKRRKRSP